MKINAVFQRKETDIETEPCIVENIIELSESEYDYFSHNLLKNFDFIAENKDQMYYKDGVNHCLLVFGENHSDGILVRSEGSNYARYSAHIPNARQLWEMNNIKQEESIKDRFDSKIKDCYSEYEKQWMQLGIKELLDNAEEIATVQHMASELPAYASDKEKEYLLKFKNPLEVVSDFWISQNGYGTLFIDDLQLVLNRIVYDKDAEVDYEMEESESEPEKEIQGVMQI